MPERCGVFSAPLLNATLFLGGTNSAWTLLCSQPILLAPSALPAVSGSNSLRPDLIHSCLLDPIPESSQEFITYSGWPMDDTQFSARLTHINTQDACQASIEAGGGYYWDPCCGGFCKTIPSAAVDAVRTAKQVDSTWTETSGGGACYVPGPAQVNWQVGTWTSTTWAHCESKSHQRLCTRTELCPGNAMATGHSSGVPQPTCALCTAAS